MTPRRSATDLRTLAALLDNTRAVAGLECLVEIVLSHEFAIRFAGACEEAADTLDPIWDDEDQPEIERWRQALEHIEWSSRMERPQVEHWRHIIGQLARDALGR